MARVEAPAPVNLEPFKSSIVALQDKFSGYNELAERYRQARTFAGNLGLEAHEAHTSLWLEQNGLIEEKEGLLRAELDSRGLAICSSADKDVEQYHHHHYEYEDTIWGSTEPLRKYGVFPKSEMTMVYSHNTYNNFEGSAPYDGYVIRTSTSFRIFCPQHAPDLEQENYSRTSELGEQYGPDEWTRVLGIDGKYVRELDGKEIGHEPKQGHVDTFLYGFFNFPEIPTLPEEVRPY